MDYLYPHDGPVIEGLEHIEVVYAKDQPEYIPLRTLRSADGQGRVFSRWTPTPEQREAIADGDDIFLELFTFGHPLQPIRMMIGDGKENTESFLRCQLGYPEEQHKVSSTDWDNLHPDGTRHHNDCGVQES